jgi:hypothetical protein
MLLPATPGTYILVLHCASTRAIRIGRLGTIRLRPGHRCTQAARSALEDWGPDRPPSTQGCAPHWHIDYLRRCAKLECAMYSSGARREHEWAATSPPCRARCWCSMASAVPIAPAKRTCTGSRMYRPRRRWGREIGGEVTYQHPSVLVSSPLLPDRFEVNHLRREGVCCRSILRGKLQYSFLRDRSSA